MHRDDSTEMVIVAGRPIVVVACAPDGSCDPALLTPALDGAPDADDVWLSVDGTPPDEGTVAASPTGTAAVTLAPMTDAVKQVDAEHIVVRTVDRSTLRVARPPALVPRRLAEASLERTPCRPLDGLDDVDEIVGLG